MLHRRPMLIKDNRFSLYRRLIYWFAGQSPSPLPPLPSGPALPALPCLCPLPCLYCLPCLYRLLCLLCLPSLYFLPFFPFLPCHHNLYWQAHVVALVSAGGV